MTDPKFTPGPWRVVPDASHEGNKRIAGERFQAVAKVYADEPVRNEAKATANANLIAAAPDLYVLALLVEARTQHSVLAENIELHLAASRALAKARGEQ